LLLVSLADIAILGQLIPKREIKTATAIVQIWVVVMGVSRAMIADVTLSKRSSLPVVKANFLKCASCPKVFKFRVVRRG
jgi:hypothetical protein